MGPLRLVSLPQSNISETSSNLLPREAAPQAQLPEYMRLLHFGVRQAELFLNSHGLSLPLSTGSVSGARLMYDDGTGPTTFTDRGIHSKKKLQLFFPMMVMLKFGIIKALLIPILLGIVFIKKVIVLGVMVLPSILSMLKACKIVPPYHHTPYHSEGFSSAGGDYASYGSQAYSADSYGKDWASANQRRTRYDAAETQARSRNLHIVVPLMIMVKLMAIKGLLIPTLLGVAAIKKFIILTVMVLPSVIHKLKVCKIVPHFVHYSPHHTHSHEFHDDYAPHHHGDIHRRIGAGSRSWL